LATLIKVFDQVAIIRFYNIFLINVILGLGTASELAHVKDWLGYTLQLAFGKVVVVGVQFQEMVGALAY
jgi:hypothetical protein